MILSVSVVDCSANHAFRRTAAGGAYCLQEGLSNLPDFELKGPIGGGVSNMSHLKVFYSKAPGTFYVNSLPPPHRIFRCIEPIEFGHKTQISTVDEGRAIHDPRINKLFKFKDDNDELSYI